MPGFNGKDLTNFIIYSVQVPTVDKQKFDVETLKGKVNRNFFTGHLYYSIDMDYGVYGLNMFNEIQKNSPRVYSALKRAFNVKLTLIKREIRESKRAVTKSLSAETKKVKSPAVKKALKELKTRKVAGKKEDTKVKGVAKKVAGKKAVTKKVPIKL